MITIACLFCTPHCQGKIVCLLNVRFLRLLVVLGDDRTLEGSNVCSLLHITRAVGGHSVHVCWPVKASAVAPGSAGCDVVQRSKAIQSRTAQHIHLLHDQVTITSMLMMQTMSDMPPVDACTCTYLKRRIEMYATGDMSFIAQRGSLTVLEVCGCCWPTPGRRCPGASTC